MGVRRGGGRRPTVTEQVRHVEICIETNAREVARKAAELAEETRGLPEGWESAHDGHYPPQWVENRSTISLIDPVVLALAQLRRFANQTPDLTDTQRDFYHTSARLAYESYGRTAHYAAEHVARKNEIYEREVAERIAARRAAAPVCPGCSEEQETGTRVSSDSHAQSCPRGE